MAFDLNSAKPVNNGGNASGGFDPSTAQPADNQSWGGALVQGAVNFVPSVGRMIGDIASTVAHPIDTATNIGKSVIGAGENLTEKLVGMADPELVAFNKQLNKPSESQQMASGIADYYKQKYGSEEGFKNAIANDPAGVMADIATVFSGGSTAAAKIPGLMGAAERIGNVSRAIDPLAITGKAIGAGIEATGQLAQKGLGMTSGAGAESIKQAYLAGKEGGQTAEQFQSNLRGTAPMQDVLDTAKSDLVAMNAQKTAEYRNNMKAVNADKTALNFDNIGNAVADAYNTVTYKGQIKNQKGAEVLQKISDAIGDWKQLDPAQYHTPEGMDALKQVVGGIVETIPFEEKTARMVGGNIYNAIKGEIVKQAPVYAKTMQDYSEASDAIKEIERALSLGQKASADMSMRKLQSLMRNNASTNYGNRLQLAQELEQAGGKKIMPALAGQALNTWTPRSLQSASTVPTALLGYGAGGAPLALGSLAAASPRLVGEAAYYTGKTAPAGNALVNILKSSRAPANLAYQLRQR